MCRWPFSGSHACFRGSGKAPVGEEPDPRVAEEVRRHLGLDRPLALQYLAWLGSLLHGDLGRSIKDGTPVGRLILEKLPTTLELSLLALMVAILIGVPAGLWAAVRREAG